MKTLEKRNHKERIAIRNEILLSSEAKLRILVHSIFADLKKANEVLCLDDHAAIYHTITLLQDRVIEIATGSAISHY